MEELEQVLRSHGRKYPLMEPVDAVKLIYQNEFGGGHLIRDPETCLEALGREYENTPQSTAALLEPIGNGMVRVMLRTLDANGYTVEQLGQDFLHSSRQRQGSLSVFLEKLKLLREVTAAGVFGFDEDALESYLVQYRNDGYPMVSHSTQYRQAYAPAYRVLRLEDLSVRKGN